MAWKVDKTAAEKLVIRSLQDLMTDSPYRSGVLLLSYPPTDPEMDCRIAQTAVFNGSPEGALDLVLMARALRELAEKLEAVIAGREPMPEQPEGRGRN